MKGKLLLVINHLDWFWSHRLPLALGAQAAGWEVLVAAPGAAKDPALGTVGLRGLSLPEPLRLTGPALMVRQLWRYVVAERPAIIHAITIKSAFLAGVAVSRQKGLRRIYTIAGLGYLFRGDGARPLILRKMLWPVLRWVFRDHADWLIFQNRDDMSLFVRQGLARAERMDCIQGSGVDLEQFWPRPEPETAKPMVLMPTRLVREKGVEVFAAAARILRSRGSNAHFVVAGGLTDATPTRPHGRGHGRADFPGRHRMAWQGRGYAGAVRAEQPSRLPFVVRGGRAESAARGGRLGTSHRDHGPPGVSRRGQGR
ncbi:MAG: glycosyltransferase family 4 protein [Rhodospirillales bacterium]|nr:glycosyltransferase family 4 protein [Rhodospirillales bacterium]